MWLEQDDEGGVADGATGTIAFWYKPTGNNATFTYIFATGTGRLRVTKTSANILQVVGQNAAGGQEFDIRQNSAAVSALTDASGWSQVLISWDNNTAGACYVVIANASTSWALTDCTNRVDDTGGGVAIDLTGADWAFGASNGGGSLSAAEFSEFYFTQTYLDVTNSTVQANFYDGSGATGKPAGDLTSYNAPVFYLPNPYTSFTTDAGSGGNWVKKGTTALLEGTAP